MCVSVCVCVYARLYECVDELFVFGNLCVCLYVFV
jgi:hypothetical protein